MKIRRGVERLEVYRDLRKSDNNLVMSDLPSNQVGP